jgi:uncharacterized protein involved in response to NO
LRADRFFFPAAAGFAAIAVPAWLLQYLGVLPLPAEGAAWHGHEMLFGFALAVVAGYLLARPSRTALHLAIAAWAAGRLAPFLPALPGGVAALLALAFPILLFALAGRALLGAAKSGRNRVFGIVLGGFVAAELVYQAGAIGLLAHGETIGVGLGLGLVLLLLFTMGGRVLAAAASGALQRRGLHLPGMAQRRLELVGRIALLVMIAAGALDQTPIETAAALAAGIVILLRLVGWRAWRIAGDAALTPLLLGYAMLGLGLVLYGPMVWSGLASPAGARHLSAIGGLGGLAFAMMLRVAAQRDRRSLRPPVWAMAGATLVALAAFARASAELAAPSLAPLLIAAALWSMVFLALALHLATAPGRAPSGRHPR